VGNVSEEKKVKKKTRWIIIPSVVLMLVIITGIILYTSYRNSIYNPISNQVGTKKMEVVINKGSGPSQIADTLYNEGLIRNKTTFRIYMKLSKLDRKIKAGKYEFTTDMNVVDIVDKMVKGQVKLDTIKVTIPEGYEIKNIAEAVEKAGLVKKEDFLKAAQEGKYSYDFLKDLPDRSVKLEGYLFPDTYEFSKDATAEEIINRMLERFDEVFNSDMRQKAKSMNLSIDKIVTMASIVEREAKVAEERPVVAAVFYNRLKIKMPLQSCATIQYALGERKEKLLNKDLEIKSPYNTYKNGGLPIGPIANPGKASLEAALNPADVKYLYFVLTDPVKGTHTFTVSYDDFLNAKHGD
jgi:UPF0755 protein